MKIALLVGVGDFSTKVFLWLCFKFSAAKSRVHVLIADKSKFIFREKIVNYDPVIFTGYLCRWNFAKLDTAKQRFKESGA